MRLGMPLTAAKPFLKKITKPKSCKIGPWERDGSATVTCDGLKLTVVTGKSADELLIAALYLSTSQGGDDLLRKVQKKNGPPCAATSYSDAGSSDFWGYDANGRRAANDTPGCTPVLPEAVELFWSTEEVRCAPGDLGSYVITRDLTSYSRNDEDLGIQLLLLSCGMLAMAKPRLQPIAPQPRQQ